MLKLFKNQRLSHDKFSQWIAPHLDSLYASAYHFTGNPDNAEDLLQDLLTELFAKAQWAEVSQPRAWLQRCLYYRFIDQYRKNKHFAQCDTFDEQQSQLTTDDNAEQILMQRDLRQALYSLKPNQRAILCLCDIRGFGLTELSNTLGIPLGTLKSDLHRARKALKSLMQPAEENRNIAGLRSVDNV